MRITYDPEADALYIELRDAPRSHTVDMDRDSVADIGEDGRVVGFEILGAKGLLSGEELSRLTYENLVSEEKATLEIDTVLREDQPTGALPYVEGLKRDFHNEMVGIYLKAKAQAGYDAKVFLGMVVDQGGFETARRLLAASQTQYGFDKLWEKGRLDLTVEYLVLMSPWRELFQPAELQEARSRLLAHGFPAAKLP